MLAEIYRPEPAAKIGLASGEEVQMGFVVEGASKRMGNIFAVEGEPGCWLAFDVRKVASLVDVFKGVSKADSSRLRAVGEAIIKNFASRELLAWALAGTADTFAVNRITQ